MKVFLETERLILRYLTESDLENLFQLDSDPEVMRFITGGKTSSYEDIKNKTLPVFLDYYEKYGQFGAWGAIEKSSNNFLGWFIFRPAIEFRFTAELNLAQEDEIELGYRLCKSSWGKGYGTEGAKALIDKGFTELNVNKVCAFALKANQASTRVMQKSGLKLEREFSFTQAQLTYFEELERQAVKYSLTKNQFWES